MSTSDKGRGVALARPGHARRSEALQKLERGELTLDEYLDLKVEQALARVQGRVSAEQREFLRELAREQLATDSVLSEYVRCLTRRAPGLPTAR